MPSLCLWLPQCRLMTGCAHQVGQTYEQQMRARAAAHAPAQLAEQGQGWPDRIVDKMLRNAWNMGYIAIMLPRATVSTAAAVLTWTDRLASPARCLPSNHCPMPDACL